MQTKAASAAAAAMETDGAPSTSAPTVQNRHIYRLASPIIIHYRLCAKVWRPGIDPLAEDEELDYDPTAYDCLHRLQLDWPCLR